MKLVASRLSASGSSWNCRCGINHGKFACRVPPSPDVMAAMYMEYKRSADYKTKSFSEYLASIGFTDPSVGMVGMDDDAQFVSTPGGQLRLSIPSQPVVMRPLNGIRASLCAQAHVRSEEKTMRRRYHP